MSDMVCQRCGQVFEARRSDTKWCPQCKVLQARERSQAYEHRAKSPCVCGRLKVRGTVRCRLCNNKSMVGRLSGADNPNWKGGGTRNADGYIFVRRNGKYVPEHRIIWERVHGPIPSDWIVHHKNGVKDDNRLENLDAMPKSRHHAHGREVELRDEITSLKQENAELREIIARLCKENT